MKNNQPKQLVTDTALNQMDEIVLDDSWTEEMQQAKHRRKAAPQSTPVIDNDELLML